MPADLVDSHTHLDAEVFDNDREEVLERALRAGVTRIINVGATGGFEGTRRSIVLAEEYDFVWATAGVHPHDSETPLDKEALKDLATHEKIVAIGETGLDFYRDWSPRPLQRQWFKTHIEVALEMGKPLIIHSRDAGAECLALLTEMQASEVGGVFHCYAEDADFASKLAEMNFLVSFPGTITFKKADALRATLKAIPLEQIMLETDAPYMAPEPYRGKRCESAYVFEIAAQVAKVKNLSFEKVALETTKTACNFFRIGV